MAKKIDKKAGSLAYNRLDMQISQVLHLALEFYDSLNYLFILDYYDDIALFDDESNNGVVSYYQMKTSENTITLNTVLSERWIDKLYAHLSEPNVFVKELGLITNCNVKMDKAILSAEKTRLMEIDSRNVNKIKQDIATRNSIPVGAVDLTKFVHMRTTLSIDRHRDIVEKETSDFLFDRFPQIKMQTVKTIFLSIMSLLNQKQSYESLSNNAEYCEVKNKKGFSKNIFEKIIDMPIKIRIPEYGQVRDVARIPDNDNEAAALAYTYILTDNNVNSEKYISTFDELDKIISYNPINESENSWQYAKRCRNLFSFKLPDAFFLYNNSLYIEVLVICILISRGEVM
jgi:hypothetical protein